jgi:hypothetical protein
MTSSVIPASCPSASDIGEIDTNAVTQSARSPTVLYPLLCLIKKNYHAPGETAGTAWADRPPFE